MVATIITTPLNPNLCGRCLSYGYDHQTLSYKCNY
jgi:hypothetical protein